jgi:hypothetical protein
MIVEQRTYTLQPGVLPELLETYEREGMAVHRRILGNMIGYFYTEIGPLNQIVHLWGYDSLEDRARRRAELAANEQWGAYVTKGVKFLQTQESKILVPAPFSPIK